MFALGALPPANADEVSPALIAAAKKEGRVVFYTPLIVDQVVRPLAAAFRAKYGIPVDYARMDSDSVVLKILNENRAGHGGADGRKRSASSNRQARSNCQPATRTRTAIGPRFGCTCSVPR